MTTSAEFILREYLCNKVIHAFSSGNGIDEPGTSFCLRPIWPQSVACTLRIINLHYEGNGKGRDYTLTVKPTGWLKRLKQVDLRPNDAIRFVDEG